MKKNIFFLFCLHLALAASAQENSLDHYVSEYTYIYKLNKDDVYAMHVQRKTKKITPYLHALIDSVKTKDVNGYPFSIGNYLLVFASKEELKIEEKVVRNIYPRLIRNGKDFQLLVLDENGNAVDRAEVILDGERIAFDRQRQYYFKPDMRQSNILKITYGDNFICGRVDVSKDRKDLDFYVDKVIVLGERILQKTKPGIATGYLLTSKPLYRLGDTVKVKAIAYKHSKPYRKKADLFLSYSNPNSYRQVQIKIAELLPDQDGNFLFNFKLSDTLLLDKQYTLVLRNKKLNIENEFLVKDYRLEDYTFTTHCGKKNYRAQDTITFSFDAHDVFGNPLDNAKIRIQVSTQRLTVKKSMPDYIPFSIIDSTVLLTSGRNNRFVIPQSNLPQVAGTFLVDLFYTDAQHHSKKETLEFSVEDNSNYFNIKREDSLTVIEHFQNDQSIASSATLLFTDDGLRRTIVLPFKGYIHPYLIPKTIVYQDQYYPLLIPGQEEPQFVYEKTTTGYNLTSANVNRIRFSYQLFRNKKRIAEGYGTDYSFKVKDSDKGIYTIKANYFSNGYEEVKKVFSRSADGLSVTTDFPASVKPGDSTSFTITVKNKRNHPVKGLNITASALDAKFKSVHYPEYGLSRPSMKVPETDMSLEISSAYDFSEHTNAQWNRLFHVDTSLYYQFAHPQSNGFYHYADNKDSIAEFAPHVMNNQYRSWISYILVDDEPVYFNHYEYLSAQRSIVPFSFTAAPGYHRISIRTIDHLIEIDSVLLISGKKLNFSIDISREHQSKCKIIKVGGRFSKAEVDKLKARKVFLTNHLHQQVIVDMGYTKASIHRDWYFIVFNDQPLIISHLGKQDTIPTKGITNIDIYEKDIVTAFDAKVKPVVFTGYSLKKNRTYSSAQPPNDLLRMVYYTPSAVSREVVVQPHVHYEKNYTIAGRGTFFLNNYTAQPWLSYSLLRPDSSSSFYDEIYPLIYDVQPGPYDLIVRYDSLHVTHKVVNIMGNAMTIIDAKLLLKDTSYVSVTAKDTRIAESFDKINIQNYVNDYRYSYQSDRASSYQSSFTYSRRLRFNPRNRYVMIGGGLTMTQWDLDQSGLQPKNFISFEIFVAHKLSPRITGELNLQYLHANQSQSALQLRTKQLILSSFFYVDLFENRGKYVKRADWTPFLKTGFSASFGLEPRSTSAVRPAGLQPMVPVGVGLRYKFAKHIDLSASVVRYINLLGGTYNSHSLGSFNQLDASVIYIIPAKVICPKFDGGRRSYHVATVDNNYIFENDLKVNPSAEPVKVRTSFHDLAYWQPALKTDAQGKVTYNVKFPEDITVWKNYIIGVGKHNRRLTKVDYIAAILPLTIKLNTPRFLIAQDSFTVYSQLLNATQELGFEVHCVIKSGHTVVTKDTLLVRKATVSANLQANDGDSVTVQGVVQSLTVGNDGESVKIPVMFPGVMNATGVSFSTATDTSFTFSTDSIVSGKLIVNPSALDDMMKDLEKLAVYPYTCMEQTASKLKGLLLLKSISKSRGQVFKNENDIQKLLKRLADNQQLNGSWGWWSSGSDEGLTAYITLVLKQADSMGYTGGQYKRSLEYLKHFEKDSVINTNILLTLSEMKVPLDSITLNALQQKKYSNDIEAINRLRILQLNNRPYEIKELLALMKEDALVGSYWGGETWDWRNNQIPATLLAYKILKQHGGHEATLEEIRHYLYSIKENGQWRNTVETATIVDLLLRETKPVSTTQKAELFVNGKKVTLPYMETLRSHQTYNIHYKTNQPLFVSYYKEQWNSHPQKEGNNFKIATQFIKEGKAVQHLVAGEEYLMEVKIDVVKSAAYVMIEVPIPAGCLQMDDYRSAVNETHRENFREKTNIYLSRARTGTYTYYVPIKASYAGLYTVNPARVSLMYFPAFFGQEKLKKICIKEN